MEAGDGAGAPGFPGVVATVAAAGGRRRARRPTAREVARDAVRIVRSRAVGRRRRTATRSRPRVLPFTNHRSRLRNVLHLESPMQTGAAGDGAGAKRTPGSPAAACGGRGAGRDDGARGRRRRGDGGDGAGPGGRGGDAGCGAGPRLALLRLLEDAARHSSNPSPLGPRI